MNSTVSLDGVRVVIPMLNASRHLDALLPALSRQEGLEPSQVLIIDSESNDDTATRSLAWGAEVHGIRRSEFNHGGTRRMATSLSEGFRFLVFLTQDAIPASPNALMRLVSAFQDPEISVAYGRQLPRTQAGEIERHARLFNYPCTSEIRTMADVPRHGMRTCFCSNSFAAYRLSALREVGGFPINTIFAEDQIVVGRMLLSGHSIAYVGDAEVIHSHGYSMREEMTRYFDIGVFHSRNKWLLDAFGSAENAGSKFVLSELLHLLRTTPWRIPEAALRTVLKYTGYKLGRAERRLPNAVKLRLSMQPSHWRQNLAGTE